MRRLPVSQPARAAGLALAVALAGTACGPAQPGGVAPVDPEATVRQFLNAVKANSLAGMAALWGTSKGPASQSMNHEEMDKRLTVIKSFLAHDSFEFQPRNMVSATSATQRVLDVRITRKACTPVVPFTVVRWGNGWLVQDIDLAAAGNPARPCGPDGTPGR
jgi:hypothetical protein